jgi:hypothetical protein
MQINWGDWFWSEKWWFSRPTFSQNLAETAGNHCHIVTYQLGQYVLKGMSEQDIIMFDSGKGPKEPCFFRVAQFVSLRSCRFRGYLLHAFSFVLPAGTGCHWLVIRYNSWLCVVAARFTWFTAKSWCCSALLISDETTILVFVFELISCLGLFLHTSPPVGAHNPKLVGILKTTCRALVCYPCRCRLNSGYHYQTMQNKALSWTCVHQCKTWTMQCNCAEPCQLPHKSLIGVRGV